MYCAVHIPNLEFFHTAIMTSLLEHTTIPLENKNLENSKTKTAVLFSCVTDDWLGKIEQGMIVLVILFQNEKVVSSKLVNITV